MQYIQQAGTINPPKREPLFTDPRTIPHVGIDVMPIQDKTLVYTDERVSRQNLLHYPHPPRESHPAPVYQVELAVTT